MTVTPEMREAGSFSVTFARDRGATPAEIAEAAYLAMRALDPEVAEFRLRIVELSESLGRVGAEVFEVQNRLLMANAFLRSQGYTRADDGTWSGGRVDALEAKCMEIARKADAEVTSLRGQLAALRPVVEAATWRPIETAPKVTRILVRYKCGVVEIAALWNTPTGYVWTGDDGETDEARPDADSDPRTHWMPLPDEVVPAYQESQG